MFRKKNIYIYIYTYYIQFNPATSEKVSINHSNTFFQTVSHSHSHITNTKERGFDMGVGTWKQRTLGFLLCLIDTVQPATSTAHTMPTHHLLVFAAIYTKESGH